MPGDVTPYRATLLQDAVRWLYSCILACIIPFAFLNLMLRGAKRAKEYNQRRFERFGFVKRPASPNGYLIHCVSVGEVVAASVLIKRIMQEEPDTAITVTTTTPTGSARVRAIFGDKVHHFYLPYDLHMAMAGMIKRVRPKAVLITEVELWPNLIHACWKRHIAVVVINARMTDRSAKRYAKVPVIFTPMLQKIAHVCAQGQRDYNNYRNLGVAEHKLTLTNNIKFDQAASHEAGNGQFMGMVKGVRPVIVGGSTHDTEEQALLETLHAVLPDNPSALLILVPRHPERFGQVEKLIQSSGLRYQKSSETQLISSDTQVLLVNEMGRLNSAYQIADMAFVGGSLADRGGHNALEPAAVSVPVLMGPNTYNNPVICSYLQEKGALTLIHNAQEMSAQCQQWLMHPEQARASGEAGKQVLRDNQGAVDKTIACLQNCLVKK